MRHGIAILGIGVALLVVAAGRAEALEKAKQKDSEVRAAPLVLVDKGASLAPIIVFSNAPPRTRQVADELAAYIEKISGVKPQVIEGLPNPVPAHAIWVGYQPKLKELFPKTDFDFKHPEEILIACDGKNLVIAGRDRWDPQHLAVIDRFNKPNLKDWQQEFGTINAVFTFLQEDLDVRWLWPGAIGEDIIKKEKIAFAPFEYRYHPQIRMRGGILSESAPYNIRTEGTYEWGRFQRMQLDSSNRGILFVTHCFGDWWDRFHETHPEYFALQPDGTRSGYPGHGGEKICQ